MSILNGRCTGSASDSGTRLNALLSVLRAFLLKK